MRALGRPAVGAAPGRSARSLRGPQPRASRASPPRRPGSPSPPGPSCSPPSRIPTPRSACRDLRACARSRRCGSLREGGVPTDRALEADEAPVVPVRRGELDRLVEEGRVVEELAGDVDGVPGRREWHELEHAPLRRLRHRRDREPVPVRVVRHQHPDPARDGDYRHPVVGRQRPDDATSSYVSGQSRTYLRMVVQCEGGSWV